MSTWFSLILIVRCILGLSIFTVWEIVAVVVLVGLVLEPGLLAAAAAGLMQLSGVPLLSRLLASTLSSSTEAEAGGGAVIVVVVMVGVLEEA